jgi:bla regulator protein blaR1
VAAMLAVFICFIYTMYAEVSGYTWTSLNRANTLALLPSLNLPVNPRHFIPGQSLYNSISGFLPYISAIYIAGLAINLLKFGGEWNKIRLIKRSVIPAGQMQQFINTFSKKLDIKKYIQLKFSDLIDVPCMIGYFKPVILLPVSLATYLTACEIEAILLHELAHIKRNDYLINLLQQVAGIMLFFNPFVQLFNRIINQERENGCDDLVVEKTSKPLIYARALLKLEESRVSNLKLALAATGKKYHLLNRIERIMKTKKPIGNVRHLSLAILLLAGSLGCIAWLNPNAADAKTTKPGIRHNSIVAAIAADTTNTHGSAGIKDAGYVLVNDTTKHKHKGKIVVTDKKGHRKEYDPIDSLPPEWKNQFEAIRKQGEEMRKKFNSPEWKKSMEDMKLQGEEMRKKFESPEWKNQMLAMKLQGEEMRKKFNSPEWKKSMEDMKLRGEEMRKKFESPEWKKSMENMKLQGEEMKKKFNSPEWKKSMEDMKLRGEEMRKKFESPEWKKSMENMKLQGEEMKKKFNSPEWKKSMEDMKLRGEEMRKKFNSPEWKAQMELMRKEGKEMRKYMKGWIWDSSDSVKAAIDTVKK